MTEVLDTAPDGERSRPVIVANGAGLRMELNRDGGVRRIWFGENVVNLFMGNGVEPGPTNVWLRLRRGAKVEAVPLLGPQSPLRTVMDLVLTE